MLEWGERLGGAGGPMDDSAARLGRRRAIRARSSRGNRVGGISDRSDSPTRLVQGVVNDRRRLVYEDGNVWQRYAWEDGDIW